MTVGSRIGAEHNMASLTNRTVCHAVLVTAFAAVWGWHLTPKANSQEVAQKFGWFFNYLTFYSFSVQLFQFCICLIADMKPKVH